jgi:hypothetical protein
MSTPALAAPWDNTAPATFTPSLGAAFSNVTAQPLTPALDGRIGRGIVLAINDEGNFTVEIYTASAGGAASRWELRDADGGVVSTHTVTNDSATTITVESGFGGGALVLLSELDAIQTLGIATLTNVTSLSVNGAQGLTTLTVEDGTAFALSVVDCPVLSAIDADDNDIGESLTLSGLPALHVVDLGDNGMAEAQVDAVLRLLSTTRAGKTGTRTINLQLNSEPSADPGITFYNELLASGWSVTVDEPEG